MKKGFTLLEMVVVITVLSILFLLTIPNIQKVLTIVDDKGCDALVKVVDSSIIQYRLVFDNNPISVNDLINANLISEQQTKCSNGKSIYINDGQAYAK